MLAFGVALVACVAIACDAFTSTDTGSINDTDSGSSGPPDGGKADADAGCTLPAAFCENFDNGTWSDNWTSQNLDPAILFVESDGGAKSYTSAPGALVFRYSGKPGDYTSSQIVFNGQKDVMDCAIDVRLDAIDPSGDIIVFTYTAPGFAASQVTFDGATLYWEAYKGSGNGTLVDDTRPFAPTTGVWTRVEIRLDIRNGTLTGTQSGNSVTLSPPATDAGGGIQLYLGGLLAQNQWNVRFDTLRCVFE